MFLSKSTIFEKINSNFKKLFEFEYESTLRSIILSRGEGTVNCKLFIMLPKVHYPFL